MAHQGGITPLNDKLLALIGTGGINSLGLPKREIFLLDIIVAGTTHVDNIHELKAQIIPGTLLKMVRRPKNIYDEKAIALFMGADQIGYVPRTLNLIISRLMDAGKEFYAKVTEVTERGEYYQGILCYPFPYREVTRLTPIGIGKATLSPRPISMHQATIVGVTAQQVGQNLAKSLWIEPFIDILNSGMYILLIGRDTPHLVHFFIHHLISYIYTVQSY